MSVIAQLLLFCIEVYFWIIIISVLISWLIAFDVINVKNQKSRNLIALLEKATEPVYKPIRKYVKPIGGIDITPLIVIFALMLLENLIFRLMLH